MAMQNGCKMVNMWIHASDLEIIDAECKRLHISRKKLFMRAMEKQLPQLAKHLGKRRMARMLDY